MMSMKKVKLPQCESCFFEPSCYGFWEDYFTLFGLEGIEPVERTQALDEHFPGLADVWDGREARPELISVRKKGQKTKLTAEVATALPLPWKEGRASIKERRKK